MTKVVNDIESMIVKYLRGNLLPGDVETLMSWINESDANQLLFDQIREIWLVTSINRHDYNFNSKAAFERFKSKADRPVVKKEKKGLKPGLRFWKGLSIASVAACAASILGLIFLLPSDAVETFHEITNPYGSISRVSLPDGSEVTINAGSTLRYSNLYGQKDRSLWLDGEAYFVVEKSDVPFIVHSQNLEIVALGTEFNVRAYSADGKIETTLVEGKVSIKEVGGADVNLNNEVVLMPNQKLTVISKTGEQIIDSTEARPETVVASNAPIVKIEEIVPVNEVSWKNDSWVIYRERLEDLAVKLERRYDIRIELLDEELRDFRYNGTLPDGPVESVLEVMCMVSPLRYRLQGKDLLFWKEGGTVLPETTP